MADPLLDNTKAIEEMVASMRQQVPVGGTPYSNSMQRSLDELTSRLDKLAELYRMGARPGSLAAQAARASVVEQQNYAAERFASLTKPEQKAFMPQMEVLQKEQVEKEELERRKKMNQELLRGQYAISTFVKAASEGHIGGMIGAGAGFVGGAVGGAGGLAAVLVDMVQKAERERSEAITRGGATASPSLESTEQASRRLAEAAEAIRVGEEGRKTGEARRDQLLAQARQMPGWNLAQDPTFWANRLGQFPGMARFTPGMSAAQQQGEATRAAAIRGASPQEARTAGMEALNRFLEDWIRSKGGKPEEFRRNIMIPGVEAGITSEMGYQSEVQVGALNAARQDVDTQIMQLQLQQLIAAGGALQRIVNNTNGLEDLRPQWGP